MDDTKPPYDHLIDMAVERIGDRFRGAEASLRQRITKPINEAYVLGAHDFRAGLVGSAQVAKSAKRSVRMINQIAADNDIGWRFGQVRLFTPEDQQEILNIVAERAANDGRRRKGE